jgi:hypothetical protein
MDVSNYERNQDILMKRSKRYVLKDSLIPTSKVPFLNVTTVKHVKYAFSCILCLLKKAFSQA